MYKYIDSNGKSLENEEYNWRREKIERTEERWKEEGKLANRSQTDRKQRSRGLRDPWGVSVRKVSLFHEGIGKR